VSTNTRVEWSYRLGFYALLPPALCFRRTRNGPAVSHHGRIEPRSAQGLLAIETREHRRTVLVTLRGELDLTSASCITPLIEGLRPEATGVRHIVLDLRGLTFMDCAGLREILKQNDYARTNHHNVAFVRGKHAVQQVLALTETEKLLVLVDDPDELAPPLPSDDRAAPAEGQ
jgi:anti-anti-sigma factor